MGLDLIKATPGTGGAGGSTAPLGEGAESIGGEDLARACQASGRRASRLSMDGVKQAKQLIPLE